MALTSLDRPRPTGTSDRGRPLYSGPEMALWRRAMGVQQGHVARAMRISQPALSIMYENRRVPGVVLSAERAGRYFAAVEAAAADQAADREAAAAELRALRASRRAG